ncbi:hypothetical protein BG000_005267 [Podila horticola]|nr:hypothetical protein BG000_005267 [Podila horticola]
MDDFYQFMTPIGDAPTPPPSTPPTTTTSDDTTAASQDSPSTSSTTSPSARSSWSTWGASSAWGASLNKFIERGKKDMNEFVDVTRKDLNELVQTVQAESSTTVASLSKKVEDLKKSTTLPASVSAVVEGIKQEFTEAATGLSSHVQQPQEEQHKDGEQEEKQEGEEGEARKSTSQDATADKAGEDKASKPEGEAVVGEASTTSTTASTAPRTRAEKTTSSSSSGLSFASTASLFTAGANTLTQTLTSSTKDIGTSANQLFKTLPAVAEKHLGEADQFLKSTTETLKSNGLIAEQYVNKLGSGVANFINSAVVISAPEEKEQTGRSKKMFFDRKAAMLEQLRLDPATYTVDPMTTIADSDIVGLERYKYFLQTFNMAEYQQRIARLLNEYPEVKALMHKLVPIDVADEELFWLRYHFRLFEIEEEEKRRKKLVQEVGNDAEDEFTWDDDEEEDSSDNKHQSQQQHGSTTPKASSTTPKAGVSSTLTPEALASSLSALPVPSSSDKIHHESGSEDEWGAESPKAAPAAAAAGATLAVAAKSPTNMSSTRTSEDSYAVVDGVETPIRGGGAAVNSVQSMSSAASSPRVEQPAQQASKKEAKEEDDWSDWE